MKMTESERAVVEAARKTAKWWGDHIPYINMGHIATGLVDAVRAYESAPPQEQMVRCLRIPFASRCLFCNMAKSHPRGAPFPDNHDYSCYRPEPIDAADNLAHKERIAWLQQMARREGWEDCFDWLHYKGALNFNVPGDHGLRKDAMVAAAKRYPDPQDAQSAASYAPGYHRGDDGNWYPNAPKDSTNHGPIGNTTTQGPIDFAPPQQDAHGNEAPEVEATTEHIEESLPDEERDMFRIARCYIRNPDRINTETMLCRAWSLYNKRIIESAVRRIGAGGGK